MKFYARLPFTTHSPSALDKAEPNSSSMCWVAISVYRVSHYKALKNIEKAQMWPFWCVVEVTALAELKPRIIRILDSLYLPHFSFCIPIQHISLMGSFK